MNSRKSEVEVDTVGSGGGLEPVGEVCCHGDGSHVADEAAEDVKVLIDRRDVEGHSHQGQQVTTASDTLVSDCDHAAVRSVTVEVLAGQVTLSVLSSSVG